MNPDRILDRTEACRTLGISRPTLISWIRKGKLKVWKRVGHGSNAALLFERKHVESRCRPTVIGFEKPNSRHHSKSEGKMLRHINYGLGVLLSFCMASESFAVGARGL